MLGGYIAGCYLARMPCYGRLGPCLKNAGINVHIVAGHPDSVGGLKPIGVFYFYQAMVVGIPAIFLAIWLLLIPLPHFKPLYQHWQAAYAGLLALAIGFEMFAFLVPLRSFHRDMAGQKRLLLQEADRLAPEITLADKTARYCAIEQLPTWPIDQRTNHNHRTEVR